MTTEKTYLLLQDLILQKGTSADTVKKWRYRGVPQDVQIEIILRAAKHGFVADRAIFEKERFAELQGKPLRKIKEEAA